MFDFAPFLNQSAWARLLQVPGAVARLRGVILQLAVRGRLVSQNPDDEAAQVLAARIARQRAQMVKEGKLRQSEPLPGVGEDEQPFELPHGWMWTRLREVTHDLGQKQPSERFTYIDVTSINKELGVISDDAQVLEADVAPSRARKVVGPGTVIYSTVRPYLLNIAVVDREFEPEAIASTAFAILHPFEGLDARYLFFYLRSQPFTDFVSSKMVGMAYPAISDSDLRPGPVPLPPLAEQKRIVAKVDELMALCDLLEAQGREALEARSLACQAALRALSEAASPGEIAAAWERLGTRFDALFDAPETVAGLRACVLQLAVQGRLVAQDPDDEPAQVLAGRIAHEKARLAREKKLKKSDPLPPVQPDEQPFALPNGWMWARFSELGEFGRGKSKHRPRNDSALYSQGKYPVVQTGDVARANGKILTYTGLYNETGLAQSRLWPQGTLCITIAANIADSSILGFDACFPDSIVGFVPSSHIGSAKYYEWFIRTVKNRLTDFAPSTAQKNINMGILDQVLIPVPPLEEQKRIVAKVSELLAQCDALEAGLRAAQESGRATWDAIEAQLRAD